MGTDSGCKSLEIFAIVVTVPGFQSMAKGTLASRKGGQRDHLQRLRQRPSFHLGTRYLSGRLQLGSADRSRPPDLRLQPPPARIHVREAGLRRGRALPQLTGECGHWVEIAAAENGLPLFRSN